MKPSTIKAGLILAITILLLTLLMTSCCNESPQPHYVPSYYDATEELPDSAHESHAKWVDEQMNKWDSGATTVTLVVEDGFIIFYVEDTAQFKIRPDEFNLFETWIDSIIPADTAAITYIQVVGLPTVTVYSYITGNYGLNGLIITDRAMFIGRLTYDIYNLCSLSSRKINVYGE